MPETCETTPTRLADQLERAFRGGAWHGPSVMELLAGVDAARARWRPGPSGHSIAELAGHLAYWMEDARRQILGEARTSPEAGGDWEAVAPGSDAAWQALCQALEAAHCGLRDAVRALEEARLDEARPGSDTTLRGLLLGTLQHNAYHAGQIGLIRKLSEAALGKLP
ncbi:MAG TPA: DinB family protein [Holophagaceae bacterium]|uniref:DinB family protein n=1 Tax=Geothrix mesophila TaxID=2922723 RepID=UPI001FADAC38|nr:DinB family protein [Geothrix sp. SG198]HJV38713.1 DinB family protein [Geothrix sp.]HJV91171.1 DinB family protein [Holophagaceae bacterium]